MEETTTKANKTAVFMGRRVEILAITNMRFAKVRELDTGKVFNAKLRLLRGI